MIFHCSFDWYFPSSWWWRLSFHVFIGHHLNLFFWEMTPMSFFRWHTVSTFSLPSFLAALQHRELLGQGSDPSHSHYLSWIHGNTGPLTHCAAEMPPTLLHHSGNSHIDFLLASSNKLCSTVTVSFYPTLKNNTIFFGFFLAVPTACGSFQGTAVTMLDP